MRPEIQKKTAIKATTQWDTEILVLGGGVLTYPSHSAWLIGRNQIIFVQLLDLDTAENTQQGQNK